MRTVFLFLSVAVFLIFIQCSDGAPRKVRSLESDELRNMMTKLIQKLKLDMHDDSIVQNDEEKEEEEKGKVIDAVDFNEKSSSEELSNEQAQEEEVDDKEAMFAPFVQAGHEKISQNSDEN